MIYKESEKEKQFDDGIIRGVDLIVNRVYHSDVSNLYKMVGLESTLREFKTIELNLPRLCGKTTYLAKLFNKYPKTLVVTHNTEMKKYYEKEQCKHSENAICSLSHLNELFRGRKNTFKLILLDEVSVSDFMQYYVQNLSSSLVIPTIASLGTK